MNGQVFKIASVMLLLAASSLLAIAPVHVGATTPGTTLNIGLNRFATIPSLNPYAPNYVNPIDSEMFLRCYLIQYPPGSLFVPQLCNSYRAENNFTSWTFNLIPGLKWNDGSPLNASDLAVSFYLTNSTGQFSPYLTAITIVNSTAVTLTTASQPNMLLNLVNFFMVPASAYAPYTQGKGDINTYTAFDQLKCNGAYCMSQPYTTGTNPIIFSPNPNFYLGNNEYYSQVALHIYQNLQSTEAALLAGEIDGMWTPGTGNDAAPFIATPGISVYEWTAGGTSYEGVTENYQASGAPFNIQAFRQGIAYGTDRDAIAQTMYGPGYSLIPYGLGTSVAPGEQTYPYNITAAKAMFIQAGMHYSGANLDYANGTQVSVEIKFGSGEIQSQNVATLLAAQWIKLGIAAQPQLVEDVTLYNQIKSGTFQLYVSQESIDAEKACCKYMGDVAGGVALQVLELQGPPRSNDPTHYITPQIGQLMLQWYVTPLGSQAQAALGAQIQPLVAAQAAEIPLYISTNLIMYNNHISFGDNSSANADQWTGIYSTQNVVQQITYWSAWYVAKPATIGTTTSTSTTSTTTSSQATSSTQMTTSTTSTTTSSQATSSTQMTTSTSTSASTSISPSFVAVLAIVTAAVLLAGLRASSKRSRPTFRSLA